MKVLIVDDEEVLRDVLETVLRREGFDVRRDLPGISDLGELPPEEAQRVFEQRRKTGERNKRKPPPTPVAQGKRHKMAGPHEPDNRDGICRSKHSGKNRLPPVAAVYDRRLYSL